MTAKYTLAFYLPEQTELDVENQSQKPELKVVSVGQSTASKEAMTMTPTTPDKSTLLGDGHKYGRVSMDYFEVAEHGLKQPANQNKGQTFKKYIPVIKILAPIAAGLGFLAWF